MLKRLLREIYGRIVTARVVVNPRARELCGKDCEVITGWLYEEQGRPWNAVAFYSPKKEQIVIIAGPHESGQWGHDAWGDTLSYEHARDGVFPKGLPVPLRHAAVIRQFASRFLKQAS